MASLRENTPLLYSLLISSVSVALLASGLVPDAMTQFELVEFPAEVSTIIHAWMQLTCVWSHTVFTGVLLKKKLGKNEVQGNTFTTI